MLPSSRGRQPSQQQVATVLSPPHLSTGSFISKKLEISYSVDGDNPDDEYYTCVLPDDVLVELLADRLQVRKKFLKCNCGNN